MNQQRPECILLIGEPGVGKSTWIEKYLGEQFESHPYLYAVISSDELYEALAITTHLSYDTVHALVPKDAFIPLIRHMFVDAIEKQYSIINDQTNMDKAQRASKLALIPPHYVRKAVVFRIAPEVADQRRKERTKLQPGKTIPEDVIAKMRESYEEPDLTEFDEIIYVEA